jgi:hypothetical protein
MRYIIFFLYLFFSLGLLAWTGRRDSLKRLLATEKKDTVKVQLLNELAVLYGGDTANVYLRKAMELSIKNGYPNGRRLTVMNVFLASMKTAEYTEAVQGCLRRMTVATLFSSIHFFSGSIHGKMPVALPGASTLIRAVIDPYLIQPVFLLPALKKQSLFIQKNKS